MAIKEFLETNPVLVTSIATSFIGICGALGIKELLMAAYNRWCKKADEKDADHNALLDIAQKLDEINNRLDDIDKRLDAMDLADKESLDNDILILEHNILFLQRKAIKYGKVSKGCMPRYRMLFKRYKSLLEKSNIEINEETETNHEIVERMFRDGEVVDSFWEMR